MVVELGRGCLWLVAVEDIVLNEVKKELANNRTFSSMDFLKATEQISELSLGGGNAP